MKTKEDYGDALREVLDIEIEFERLTKDDLIQLTNIISGLLSEEVEEREQKKPLKTLVEAGGEFLAEWDGPVISKLRQKAEKELLEPEDEEQS